MSILSNEELEILNYEKQYDYTNFSHQNHINVIPEQDFKKLITDTFKTLTYVLRQTYGPYGSIVMVSDQNETTTTKDGYNAYERMGFSHHYKRMVYLAIQKIIERVNRNVGDGTTSCILLAEEIFNILNLSLVTPEDRRVALEEISNIEKSLQEEEQLVLDKDNDIISPLTYDVMSSIIGMASNSDNKLVETLMKALDPELDDTVVTKVRNVITNVIIDPSYESNAEYKIDYLPGDYRIRVNLDDQTIVRLSTKTQIKLALYDHAFTATDWYSLTKNHDKDTPILVLARGYNRSFLDEEYHMYVRNRTLVHQPVAIILGEVRGTHVRDEIKDLAAVLHTVPYGLNPVEVNHDMIPVVTVQLFNKNALCFFDCEPVEQVYLDMIKYNMEHDDSKSLIKHNEFVNRINALEMKTQDTIITLTAGTSLEAKMISDKIDDCVSIVNSALKYGIVPNMLRYGYYRIDEIKSSSSSDTAKMICSTIELSISKLFTIIWESKFADEKKEELEKDLKTMYSDEVWDSYDIIHNEFVPSELLATSAQYDIEVIVAALSIVKYLLTSRALIFGTEYMRMQGDEGRYVMNE